MNNKLIILTKYNLLINFMIIATLEWMAVINHFY